MKFNIDACPKVHRPQIQSLIDRCTAHGCSLAKQHGIIWTHTLHIPAKKYRNKYGVEPEIFFYTAKVRYKHGDNFEVTITRHTNKNQTPVDLGSFTLTHVTVSSVTDAVFSRFKAVSHARLPKLSASQSSNLTL